MKTALFLSTLILQSSVSFGFGIAADSFGQPVHETITKRAALDSGLIKDPQSEDLKYLIEGSRFNDDPEGYLLEGAMPEDKGGAIAFAFEFLGSKKEKKIVNDPTKSAHFGDYQFLHAMGKSTITAEKIKESIVLYAAHCWLMIQDPDSFLHFAEDFRTVIQQERNPTPNFKYSRYQLIVKNAIERFPKEVLFFHARNQAEFKFRALGSLLHVIQDSYSRGHVIREGWEEGNNEGNILYFQDYSQQDSKSHKHTDEHPKKLTDTSVFEIPATNAAYQRSKQLLTMIANNCPWTSGKITDRTICPQSGYSFISEVFAYSENTTLDSRTTRSHPDLAPKKQEANSYGENYGGG